MTPPDADRIYRANPAYECIPLARLSEGERARVAGGDLLDQSGGLLRPRPGWQLDQRLVSADTALLLSSLRDPGPLPLSLASTGTDATRWVWRLVADHVLQIEQDGAYLSGGPAIERLMPFHLVAPGDRVAQLSTAALRYAQELHALDEVSLAQWLYGFGRRPISPALSQRFGDHTKIAHFLGLNPAGRNRTLLERGWAEISSPRERRPPWRQWRAKSTPRSWPEAATPTYKLYVSPTTNVLDAAFSSVVDALASRREVRALKIGWGLPGLCRPDKLILYLSRQEDVQTVAMILQARLASCCDAHGVPFTASLTPGGLLSWGADPPSGTGAAGKRRSWREWITAQLAEHLVAARSEQLTTLEPWQYALQRLSLLGVDTDRWVVDSSAWPDILENE